MKDVSMRMCDKDRVNSDRPGKPSLRRQHWCALRRISGPEEIMVVE